MRGTPLYLSRKLFAVRRAETVSCAVNIADQPRNTPVGGGSVQVMDVYGHTSRGKLAARGTQKTCDLLVGERLPAHKQKPKNGELCRGQRCSANAEKNIFTVGGKLDPIPTDRFAAGHARLGQHGTYCGEVVGSTQLVIGIRNTAPAERRVFLAEHEEAQVREMSAERLGGGKTVCLFPKAKQGSGEGNGGELFQRELFLGQADQITPVTELSAKKAKRVGGIIGGSEKKKHGQSDVILHK